MTDRPEDVVVIGDCPNWLGDSVPKSLCEVEGYVVFVHELEVVRVATLGLLFDVVERRAAPRVLVFLIVESVVDPVVSFSAVIAGSDPLRLCAFWLYVRVYSGVEMLSKGSVNGS